MKFLPFIWRNLTRNKLRSLLTGGAIALAIALVCLLQTMPAGLNRLVEDVASNSRVVVHNEAGLVYPLPYSYLQKVRALPGVVGAASWTWFGGVFEVEKGVTFPNFAVEPDQIGVVWADWKIDAEAARGLPALPRRGDRRTRNPRQVPLEDRRSRHAQGHALPDRPLLPDRGRDPERARSPLLVPARVSRAGAARERLRPRRDGHDLVPGGRPCARGSADARDRRHVPQQRGGDRLRDREELLQELLHAARGLRRRDPAGDRAWWRSASSSSRPTPRAWRCASASARSRS